MPSYESQSLSLQCKGIDLAHPIDRMPDGKFPILQNVRVTQEGTVTTREGVTVLTAPSGVAAPVHSLSRLNGLTDATRIVGVGTHVWTGNAALLDKDSGYSGDPLSIVNFRPDQSVEAFAYIASSTRMRKFKTDGTNYQVGITPPLNAPSAALAAPNYVMMQNCEATAGWTQSGTAAAPTLQFRINDTILVIMYDTGATGWADIIPVGGVDYTFQPGAEILVDAEQALIYEAYEKIDDSTISGIIYDAGTTGLCWVTVTQPNIGIKVNSLVGLGMGGEWVRAIDVVTGKDGVVAFRCSTTGARAAGDSVIGTTSFRIYLTGTHVATNTLVGHGVQTQVTVGTGNLTKAVTVNFQLVNGRAIEVDDYVHVSVAFDKPYLVSKLTLKLDISDASFTKDYYYKTFSVSDLDPGYAHWTELKFKIADMVRVGNSKGVTLKTVASLQATVEATDTLFMTLDSWWGGGSYGADVGSTGAPFQYATRFRSSTTGTKSNPSPALRTGIPARRERVTVTLPASTDAQVTHVDLFRFGGGEDVWRLAGTYANGTASANDDQTTTTLLVNEILQFDNYVPFPVSDLPRTGTCSVSGCRVKATAGTFNLYLVPGSQIIINDGVFTLRSSPISTTLVEIEESAGALTGVAFSIPEGTLMAQPLPATWRFGGQGSGTFMMGCGDQYNPGFLRWCKGNDADAAADTGNLEITSPSEPLMMGFEYDGRAFVFSTERLFALYPNFTDTSLFTAQVVLSGNGLFARYSLCVTPYGVAWISKDGIYMWAGGKPVCLSDDLYPIFPHEGVAGATTNTYAPPDYTQPNSLRLFYADNSLYFIYATPTGRGMMRYDIKHQGWFPYSYPQDMRVVSWEDGAGVSDILYGGVDGNLYLQADTAYGDNGSDIACQIRTPCYNNGNSRAAKIYGDQVVTIDTKGLTATVQTLGNYGVFSITPPATFATNGITPVTLDISNGVGNIALASNICLDVSWTGKASPSLQEWVIAFLVRPENTYLRTTDWTDDGKSTAKYLRGCIIQADTDGIDRSIAVMGDGEVLLGTLTVNHNGQIEIPYGISPAVTHMMRLVPADIETWRFYGVVWLWDDWAELASIMTPYTNAGYVGPKYVRGVEITADTDGADQSIFVQFEGGGSGANFVINHIGNQTKPYSFAAPFIAHLLRIAPGGPVRLFQDGIKWIFDPYPDNTDMLTAWDDGGYMGDKYIRGLRLKADTGGANVTVAVQLPPSVAVASIIANHNGQSNFPYAFTPFIARNLRLAPAANMRIFAAEWEYDKYPDLTQLVTAWEDGGAPGAKFVQGMRLRADTENVEQNIEVQGDGATAVGSFPVTHNGQVRKPYSWTPFIAHTLRIVPHGNIRIFDIEWVYDPLPELAANWITQGTTHGLDGFLHSPYMRIAHMSTADITLTVTIDGVNYIYIIPNSGGLYRKTSVRLAPVKGMLWAYSLTSTIGFRLFKKDCETQIKQWGDAGAFKTVNPFGDIHQVTGARI